MLANSPTPPGETLIPKYFPQIWGRSWLPEASAIPIVGTRKDGDETLGVGQVDVDMLSNLILGRLNSRDRRLASALVMDTEHCFFCVENKRGHRGDDTVRVPPAHTSLVRSTHD